MYFKINFSKNTLFFSIIFLIYLFLFSFNGYTNNIGNPYIQRIILSNYGFNNNNFSILQDFSGITYIGNTNGIIQYDGHFFEILKAPGNPSMDIDHNGVIFVGGENDFGFIHKNNYGKSSFLSFADSLKPNINSFGQIHTVACRQNDVYFCGEKILFKWNGKNVSVEDTTNTKFDLFKVNNKIYLEKSGTGIFELLNNKFMFLPGSEYFANKDIVDILPFNKQILIKTLKEKGFYLVDNYSVEPFTTNADQFLSENLYSKACVLTDGTYAIGTRLSGIIVIDKNGKIITTINEPAGLFNSDVNNLFADAKGNLWALHNQGVSRIEIPSSYSYFNKNHGLQGSVMSVIRFKNVLYVATSVGVYYLEDLSENENNCPSCQIFNRVSEIKSMCYDFHLFNDQLFVSSTKGIYEISGKNAFLFYNRNASDITCVLRSFKNPAYIYLGHNDGFSGIRFTAGILVIEKKIVGINNKITSIAEDSAGTLWLSGNQNGIYKIDPFDNYSENLEFNHFTVNNILPDSLEWINLYSITSGTLFSTSQGLYRFNPLKEEFYKDTLLGIDFINTTNWVYPIVEDNLNNLWLNIIGKNNMPNKTLFRNNKTDSLKTLRPLPLNRVKDFFITSIHPDSNGIVWFGGSEGLIHLDMNQELQFDSDYSVIMHKITIGNDSLIHQLPFGNITKTKEIPNNIAYNLNTVAFEFSAPDYESENQVFYQYKLDGFDEKWSEWNESNFKEYTNLFEGDYKFRLRAKNIFNTISKELVYEFSVKPPFYRTTVALFIYIITTILLFLLIGKWRAFYFAREKFRLENIIHERTEEVVIQKEKADNLLERVLPKTTAKELKAGKKAGPYHYNMVTVLFSDIQGFTKISEQMDSELLIDELDKFFLQFDTVAEKYNIEKIKTIGDAYMCAGGIPVKNRTNPVEVIVAAIEMQNFMKELKRQTKDDAKHIWDLRIGIDTGPVVAGVLGRSKISYDIWGGTVNTASRMEASGEPGKVNITENTYMLIKDFFICQYRGKMPIKYKGEIDMYFVEGFMPHLASDLKGQVPNEQFFTQLQILRINDVEEFVLTRLEEGLPDNLYYHNVKHTIDVVTQVELIGRSEGISDEEMLILKTAALFHDMGHLINYDTHEEESTKLAKKILPQYHYTKEQIERISQLILVTQMPPQPKNLLEEIMCDADLDYLGRADFVPVSINLYKEYHERKKIDSILEWNQMQLKFIKNHQYFTKTAQKLREVNKKKQLENIQEEIRREIERTDE
ncbi:MAG: HD domain-containing protein [Bacteroidales bacterium]|nr:HD domain-containing protein [Bacteroidales bacterium]